MKRLLLALAVLVALASPSHAAWTVGNTQSKVAQAANTTASVTKPTGITSGDLLILNFEEIGTATTGPDGGAPTLPSGWNTIVSDFKAGTFKFGTRYTLAYKIATASEPASYTVTWGTSTGFNWAITDIGPPSAGQTIALDASGEGATNGSSAAPVSPSVSPAKTGDLWIISVGDSGSGGTITNPTSPGTFTKILDVTNQSNSGGFSYSSQVLTASGATGTATWSFAFADVVIPVSATFSATSGGGGPTCGARALIGVGC